MDGGFCVEDIYFIDNWWVISGSRFILHSHRQQPLVFLWRNSWISYLVSPTIIIIIHSRVYWIGDLTVIPHQLIIANIIYKPPNRYKLSIGIVLIPFPRNCPIAVFCSVGVVFSRHKSYYSKKGQLQQAWNKMWRCPILAHVIQWLVYNWQIIIDLSDL